MDRCLIPVLVGVPIEEIDKGLTFDHCIDLGSLCKHCLLVHDSSIGSGDCSGRAEHTDLGGAISELIEDRVGVGAGNARPA